MNDIKTVTVKGVEFVDVKPYYPDLVQGDVFRIEKFTVDNNNWRAIKEGIPYGDYIRLITPCDCVMSDTPFELGSNIEPLGGVHGDVLIAGLGLGITPMTLLHLRDVSRITIVELEPEIINMVTQHVPFDSRVKIVQGDIYEYTPDRTYDFIYLDIWNTICPDNLREISNLKRKFRPYIIDGPSSTNRVEAWSLREIRGMIQTMSGIKERFS